MTRTPWLRVLAIALPPLVFALWFLVAFLDLPTTTVKGRVSVTRYCLAGCGEVLQVEGRLLGCEADLSGLSFACRGTPLAEGEVVATFVRLPSLASWLGMSRISGTVLKIDRGADRVYERSVSGIVWDTVKRPSLFHLIYWPLAGLIIWRWPGSRFSRRVMWRDQEKAG